MNSYPLTKLFYTRKNLNKILEISTLIFALMLLFFYRLAFTTNIGVDTEQYIIGAYGKEWTVSALGRFGMYYSIMMLNLFHFSPYSNGVVFFFFFFLSVFTFVYLFSVIEGEISVYNFLFVAIFITNPLWVYQFYFTLQMVAIGIALFLEAIAFLLLFMCFYCDSGVTKIALFITSVLFLAYSFGTYQAFPEFHIAATGGVMLCFADKMYSDRSDREIRKNIYKFYGLIAVQFICGMALYYAILRVRDWGQNSYLSIAWGDENIKTIAINLLYDLKKVLFGRGEYCGYIFFISVMIVLIVWVGMFTKGTPKYVIFDLGLVYLLNFVGCFSLNIFIGKVSEPRTRFSLIFTTAFLCMYAVKKISNELKIKHKAFKYSVSMLLYLIIAISILMQINRSQKLIYTIDICEEQQATVGEDIIKQIQSLDIEDDDVVTVVGKWDAPLNYSCYKSDIIGQSSFDWDYDPNEPTSGSRRSGLYINAKFGTDWLFLPTDSADINVIDIAAAMPSYPADGYVCKSDGRVIVKLSEP